MICDTSPITDGWFGSKHTSFFFCSSLSTSACFARFSANAVRNSSNLAFFSSSVRGAISSVDSEKFECSLHKIHQHRKHLGYNVRNVRSLCVGLRLSNASKFLSAIVADHRFGFFAYFQSWRFSVRIVIGGLRLCGGDFFQRFIFVVL